MSDSHGRHENLIQEVGQLRGRIRQLEQLLRRQDRQDPHQLTQSDTPYSNCPLPYQSLDKDGHILEVNPAWLQSLGYERHDVVGRWFGEFMSHENRALFQERFSAFKTAGKTEGAQFELVCQDGAHIAGEFNGTIEFDRQGRFVRTHCIFQDITERKRAEDALQEQRDRAQTYLDLAAVMFVALNCQGSVTLVNKKACDLLGWAELDMVGKNWFNNFLPQRVREQVKGVYQELMAGSVEPAEYHENPILQRDGGERLVLWHSTVLKAGSGDITGILSSGEDITKRKQAEQELLDKRTQLKSLASELVLAQERERKRIAAHLHDDVCQNLAYVKMRLQMMSGTLDEQALIEDMTEASDTLTRMMQEVRTLSFELSPPILTEFGLEAAISYWLQEQIEQKHGLATAFMDDGQAKALEEDVQALLFRSVRELLVNVVKHSQAQRVEVSVARAEDQILIHLEDNGIGFSPDKVVIGKDTGGFGLFSIRERLSQMGGSLEIDSSPGQGCRSLLRAPLQQS
jgi:PAS domain S-box-containing protein